ncbi:helix-turn-helix transcriptional regulator [Georgenia sunbinii]|uniref:helix-turn-helix transcriptional regulator n=1 Tax=Georgenia sunbinii TaxID=3117728 RepID=UPI002F263980
MHERVLAALDRRTALTILRAPRGFGKTTSIARWLTLRDDDVATVYCALDESARLVAGFWRRLGDALAAASNGDERTAAERTREDVIAWLTGNSEPLRIVIDNFHEAGHLDGTLAIDDDLLDIIRDNDTIELIVGTRALRSLETAGALSVDVTVVRPADLALDSRAVLELAAARGITISEDEAGDLVMEVGGWPAAIRSCLDAAAVSESNARVDSTLVDGFVDTLLRDIRSDDLREFLVRTAVPEEFSAAGASAIVPGGRAIRDLRNLLVGGMLQERHTVAGLRYTYPPAIRESIVRTIAEHRPEIVLEVHRALMVVAAREDGPFEVFHHAVHAEEWETALRVLGEEWAALSVQHRGELIVLARRFPPDLLANDPRLGVMTRVLPSMPLAGERDNAWSPAAPLFLEEAGRFRGDTDTVADTAMVLFQTGSAAVFAGENDGAGYAFERLRTLGLSTGDSDAWLMGSAGLLTVYAIVGEVDRALELAEDPDLASVVHGDMPTSGVGEIVAIGCRIAVALAAADGMSATVDEATRRIVEPRRRDEIWALAIYARALGTTASPSAADRDRAVGQLRAAMRHLEPGGITEATLGTTLVELLLLAGQTGVAEQVLDRLAPSHVSQPTRAQLYLAQRRLAEAVVIAEQSLRDPRLTVRAQLCCDTTIAAALHGQGQLTAARRQFTQAVQLSRATGQRRGFFLMPEEVFNDLAAGDPEILALRAQPRAWSGTGSTAPDGIATTFEVGTNGRTGPAGHAQLGHRSAGVRTVSSAAPAPTTDRLSPREVEVIAALRQNAGPAGVAAALGVSVNTAKTHVRSVYRKLGAASREEALRLADSIAREGR